MRQAFAFCGACLHSTEGQILLPAVPVQLLPSMPCRWGGRCARDWVSFLLCLLQSSFLCFLSCFPGSTGARPACWLLGPGDCIAAASVCTEMWKQQGRRIGCWAAPGPSRGAGAPHACGCTRNLRARVLPEGAEPDSPAAPLRPLRGFGFLGPSPGIVPGSPQLPRSDRAWDRLSESSISLYVHRSLIQGRG